LRIGLDTHTADQTDDADLLERDQYIRWSNVFRGVQTSLLQIDRSLEVITSTEVIIVITHLGGPLQQYLSKGFESFVFEICGGML
jgi:hypothetical protein